MTYRADFPSTTPEPRRGGGMPAPRLSSSLARGWQQVWPWIADTIGAVLVMALPLIFLFFGEVLK